MAGPGSADGVDGAAPWSGAQPSPPGIGPRTARVTRAGVVLVLLAAVLLAACGSTSSSSPSDVSIEPAARPGELPTPPGRAPTLGPRAENPSMADGVQLDVLSGLLDDTPIFNGDFADPYALRTADALYFYSTNTATTQYAPGAHIPVIELPESSAFRGQYLGDALPVLPTWTEPGFQWAPSIWARPDGTYVMYYATPATNPANCLTDPHAYGCVVAANGPTSAMCVSRATSTSPAGPFVDDSTSAFVCPVSMGGAIDPSVFIRSDGTPWLLWKNDGDCCKMTTTIYAQQLAPDGLSVAGPPHRLISATQGWEGDLVEAPSMIRSGSDYWLFYSANLWGTPDYGIGVARCASVTGPCTKPLDHAWLSSSNGGQTDPGPGGEEFFTADGLIWMVHHALAPGQTGNAAQRRLYVDLITFPPGRPPRIASGAPAAALAEAALYYNDTDLPSQPSLAYLDLVRKVGQAFAGTTDASVLADGSLSCSELSKNEPAANVLRSLAARGLTPFQSYVVAIFAATYLCQQTAPQGLNDLRRVLAQGP